MNSRDYREKVTKATENVEKAIKTIERHYAQLEKKSAKANKAMNSNFNFVEMTEEEIYKIAFANKDDNELYWAIIEIKNKHEDIKGATKKLEEKKQILQNWEAKLERQLEVERKFQKEIPEAMKEAFEMLVADWNRYDLEKKERIIKAYRELGYVEFVKKYKYSTYDWAMSATEQSIDNSNRRSATIWMLDLYNRVYAITGEITDCSRLHFSGKALDGYVTGTEGTAKVETILAGGYNIQRLHARVLVHEM